MEYNMQEDIDKIENVIYGIFSESEKEKEEQKKIITEALKNKEKENKKSHRFGIMPPFG